MSEIGSRRPRGSRLNSSRQEMIKERAAPPEVPAADAFTSGPLAPLLPPPGAPFTNVTLGAPRQWPPARSKQGLKRILLRYICISYGSGSSDDRFPGVSCRPRVGVFATWESEANFRRIGRLGFQRENSSQGVSRSILRFFFFLSIYRSVRSN